MHRTAVVVMAVTTIPVAVWAMTVLNANPSQQHPSAPAATSLDVLQMMKDAQNLKEEQYEAH